MELARKQNRPDKVCAALCHMSMVSWFEGRYAEGLEQSERTLAIATELGYLPLTSPPSSCLRVFSMGWLICRVPSACSGNCGTMLSGKLERHV